MARGTVKIRTVLKSASENRIIMEKYYEETKSSLVGRFTNAYRYMYRNIGEALNLVVKEMVMNIENNLKKESIK